MEFSQLLKMCVEKTTFSLKFRRNGNFQEVQKMCVEKTTFYFQKCVLKKRLFFLKNQHTFLEIFKSFPHNIL